MLLLLHAPAPVGAVLAWFVVLGLLPSRGSATLRPGRTTLLLWAWAAVGVASATVWVLWWRLGIDEGPEPAYLSRWGSGTTVVTAVVAALTLGHLLTRRGPQDPSAT